MKTNRLLLIRLDGIGDYILFRNSIPIVKQSNLFDITHITLVGNLVFKEFAETFDKDHISTFIWVDIERFYYSPLYRLFIYKEIASEYYEVVINPMYSRHPSFDKIIKYSRAKNKIGFYGDLSRSTESSRSATTKYYSNIFHSNPNTRFEFEVNKSLFEYILKKKILLSKPYIETPFIKFDLTKNIVPNSKKYVAVFPGGSSG